jgi:Glycosyltransferase family 87
MVKQQIIKVLMTFAVGAILFTYAPAIRQNIAQRDFIEYWSAAKLLTHHENPYAQARVFALERGAGYNGKRPVMVRMPPWSLFMVLPLALLSSWHAWLLWSGLLVIALIICVRALQARLSPGDRTFTIFAYSFTPVLACCVASQTGIFLLLGYVLFLAWQESRPRLAGAALLLPLAKPHLFLLMFPAFIIWSFYGRRWKVIQGGVISLLIATFIPLGLDLKVFSQYWAGMGAEHIPQDFVPNMAGILRLLLGLPFASVFLPLAFAVPWGLWYAWTRRRTWNWATHGAVLLLISLFVSPYSWFTDEVLAIPAVLPAVLRGGRSRLLCYAIVNAITLLMISAQIPLSSGMYAWTSVAWVTLTIGTFSRREKKLPLTAALPQSNA